jgi:hypothetical protein
MLPTDADATRKTFNTGIKYLETNNAYIRVMK